MEKVRRHQHSVDVIVVEPLFNNGKSSLAYITYDIYGRGEGLKRTPDANFVLESAGSLVVLTARYRGAGRVMIVMTNGFDSLWL